MIAWLANTAWHAASLREWAMYSHALHDPERSQCERLASVVRMQGGSERGRAFGLAEVASPQEFRRRVPLSTHADYADAIERIRLGATGVLTIEPVQRLVPTSGSTAGTRLVPYTRGLANEFRRGIAAWIGQLFRETPQAKGGPAYWSISPSATRVELEDDAPSAVAVGFESDSAYLGRWTRPLVDRVLAVPSDVAGLGDHRSFQRATLRDLLRAGDLRLISVWHPSFLTLLLEPIARDWDDLLRGIRDGTAHPARRADRTRASALSSLDPTAVARQPGLVWPRLAVLSCWSDALAAEPAAALGRCFPQARLQGKGLVATEGIVSLPWGELHPLAVRSHFLEFLDEAGDVRLAHEIEPGRRYEVVLSTGGGLLRLRLGDHVEVDGVVGRTPSVRFVGRGDRVCDLRGEKLDEAFVADSIDRVCREAQLSASFAMLAPRHDPSCARYALFIESSPPPPSHLARSLDHLLRRNFHYRHARDLGQLAAPEVVHLAGPRPAAHLYIEHVARQGRQLGQIKPTALSIRPDWDEVFSNHLPPVAVPATPQ